ncbi:MAG: ABC transporter ATP-binding protein [Burkholderiaceae bacterium]|nr:ABC transporter ATP-binding protein [Burkholderiaceae bacterium]
MNNPIRIQAMSKSFQQQTVIKHLDWQIQPGKIIGLLGRNGAGKSTLLECALGLRDIDSGMVHLFGEEPQKLSSAIKARIGYVPQNNDLFAWLTGRQMLNYFSHLYPRWNQEKIQQLMHAWHLDPDKVISQLSPGQKQKLSIIRALAHEPDLLILDEPVASLDPVGRRDFLKELIENVINRETTVIFSTHILSDLERIAMDVAFLKDGQIIHQQALDDMIENTVQVTLNATDFAQIKPRKVLQQKLDSSGERKILAQFDAHYLELLQEKKIHINHLGLEDLFIEMTS